MADKQGLKSPTTGFEPRNPIASPDTTTLASPDQAKPIEAFDDTPVLKGEPEAEAKAHIRKRAAYSGTLLTFSDGAPFASFITECSEKEAQLLIDRGLVERVEE